MKKYWFGILAALTLCLCLLPATAAAATSSGTCGGEGDGSNLTWVLSDDGTLTVSGTGAMQNWASSSAVSWYSVRNDIKAVVIGDGVTTVGNFAFSSCNYLTDVTIGSGVTAIGDWAFSSCYKLENLTFGSGIASIGNYAFNCCEALTSVTIPNSVTTIGEEAFTYCFSLTRVTIGSGVASIAVNAFIECFNLAEFVVDSGNSNYSSQDGVLFNKDKTMLIAYPSGSPDTAYTIPSSVAAVGDCAFFDVRLTSVTLPKSITSVGVSVFCYCSKLTSVTFEGSAPSIGENAFCSVTATCYYPANDASWTSGAKGQYGGTLTWTGYYPKNGTCGEDLTWVLSDDGTLTISGTGAMTEWAYSSEVPWDGLRDQIKAVVIGDGVASVSTGAFASCYVLTSVTLGSDVASL